MVYTSLLFLCRPTTDVGPTTDEGSNDKGPGHSDDKSKAGERKGSPGKPTTGNSFAIPMAASKYKGESLAPTVWYGHDIGELGLLVGEA